MFRKQNSPSHMKCVHAPHILHIIIIIIIIIIHLFNCSGTTVRHNTQITQVTQNDRPHSNKTQHTKLHKQQIHLQLQQIQLQLQLHKLISMHNEDSISLLTTRKEFLGWWIWLLRLSSPCFLSYSVPAPYNIGQPTRRACCFLGLSLPTFGCTEW
jgi:hypothetical protein